MSVSSWKKRYVTLNGKSLLLSKSEGDLSEASTFDLNGATAVRLDVGRANSIRLVLSNERMPLSLCTRKLSSCPCCLEDLVMAFDSPAELLKWEKVLNASQSAEKPRVCPSEVSPSSFFSSFLY